MRLVETVASEFLEQIENLVGLGLVDIVELGCSLDEFVTVLGHFLDLLLAHRAAQQISAAERVAGEQLRGLHDLFLVDQHAIGLFADRLQQRMIILDFHLAMPALDEIGDQVHRSRTIERHQRRDMFHRANLELFAEIAHSSRFQLEHTDGIGLVEKVVGLGVVERKVVNGDVDSLGLLDKIAGIADDRQGLEPKEVHLQQAEVADRAHGVLGDNGAILILFERQKIVQRLIANKHAGRVNRCVAGEIFENQGGIDQFMGDLFGLVSLLKVRRHPHRFFQRHLQFVGNHLGQPVAVGITQAHDATDIPQNRFGAHCAEGDDLRHRIASIFLAHIFDHVSPAVVGKVDVDIGRVDAFRVEESFEQQPVTNRIDVRNLQHISHNRTSRRSARHACDAFASTVANKVADDQEVADEAGLFDYLHFQVKAVDDNLDRGGHLGILHGQFRVFRNRGSRRRNVRWQSARVSQAIDDEFLSFSPNIHPVTEMESFGDQFAQVTLARKMLRWTEDRIMEFAELNLDIALLGHFQRIAHRLRDLVKAGLHLLSRAQIKLLGGVVHPLGVGKLCLRADANQAIVGVRVVFLDVMNVVGGDELDSEFLGKRNQNSVHLGLLRDAVIL